MTDHDGDKSAANNSEQEQTTSTGSRCNPHISLYISIAALLMAGYAVYVSSSTHDNSAIQSQITKLDNNVAGISDQLDALSSEVQSNRENLVQTKLKKALENIRDIRNLAEEGTKAAISEVEDMLQNLTDTSDQLNTPEQTETPSANEVIRTLQNETNADEAAAASPLETKTNAPKIDNIEPDDANIIDKQTSSSESILSELLDAASGTDAETVQQDGDKPASAAVDTNKPEVNLAPAEVPSGPQAF